MILIVWIWDNIISPSWLSLIASLIAILGNRRLGLKYRDGFLLTVVANLLLGIIGIVTHQYGLLIALLLAVQAFRNWQLWGKSVKQ